MGLLSGLGRAVFGLGGTKGRARVDGPKKEGYGASVTRAGSALAGAGGMMAGGFGAPFLFDKGRRGRRRPGSDPATLEATVPTEGLPTGEATPIQMPDEARRRHTEFLRGGGRYPRRRYPTGNPTRGTFMGY